MKSIRRVLERAGLYERLSAQENLEFYGRIYRMERPEPEGRIKLHHHALIFLDEPTAGLDPVAAASLREDIAALAQENGVTVPLNTHNLTEAEKLCAQVGVAMDAQEKQSG